MRLEAVGGLEPPSHFASIQSISQTASALYLLSYTAYHIYSYQAAGRHLLLSIRSRFEALNYSSFISYHQELAPIVCMQFRCMQ